MSGCTEEEKSAWRVLSILPQVSVWLFSGLLVYLLFSPPTILPVSNILRNSNT